MLPFRNYILILFLSCLNLSCNQSESALTYQYQFHTFGTLVGVSIWGLPKDKAENAVNVITQELTTMHAQWHAWHSSPLTALNQAIASGQSWTAQDPSLIPLIQQAKYYSHLSQGLFNPAIGRLLALWGFQKDDLPTEPIPTQEQISTLVQSNPSMENVTIVDNQVQCNNPSVQLDFGAFAKGYALDIIMERLRQLGVQNAIVNMGGNLKTIGKPGTRPWMIGIRHPNHADEILAAIPIAGEESVITSGDYERYHEYQGKRYSHILDPRTGMPADGLSSVTVLDKSAALADSASTALTVAGLAGWRELARHMGLKYVMVIDTAGTVYLDSVMAERVQFQPNKVPKVVITEPLNP